MTKQKITKTCLFLALVALLAVPVIVTHSSPAYAFHKCTLGVCPLQGP